MVVIHHVNIIIITMILPSWGQALSCTYALHVEHVLFFCVDAAALDYRVEGVYLKISTLGVGWAKLQELTKYLEYFNASGKWSCAYLDRAGEKEYFLASACQEVFVPPSGNLSLRGLAVSGGVIFVVALLGQQKVSGVRLLDRSVGYKKHLENVFDTGLNHPPESSPEIVLVRARCSGGFIFVVTVLGLQGAFIVQH